MKEFYRVLKPGGVVTYVKYEYDIDNNLIRRKVLSQINILVYIFAFQQFPLSTIRKILEDIGF